jgi:hypothetical protein
MTSRAAAGELGLTSAGGGRVDAAAVDAVVDAVADAAVAGLAAAAAWAVLVGTGLGSAAAGFL